MGKPLGGNTNKLPYCHFIKLCSLRLSGDQLSDCSCVRGRKTPLGAERRMEIRSFPTRDPKWQHLMLGVQRYCVFFNSLSLSLSVDLTQGWTEIVFVFSLSKRKTHYRIYEKTHVDLYNHFKPEGMHILSVKLTFLLSLIGVTRGEWRGNLSVVVSCLRKLREKKSLLWLFSL